MVIVHDLIINSKCGSITYAVLSPSDVMNCSLSIVPQIVDCTLQLEVLSLGVLSVHLMTLLLNDVVQHGGSERRSSRPELIRLRVS